MIDNKEKEIKLHKRFIKSYKKNTQAIFFSFALTFMLLTTMLVLMHTNHRIANIQAKTEFTPSDCYIDDLSKQQIAKLKEDKSIEKLTVQQTGRYTFKRNNQTLFLTKGDNAAITMMAKVLKGRMPEQEGEVVAEKWALLNLGIEPVINQNFVITDIKTGELKEFKLVGILSDMLGNKKYGVINLYTTLDKKSEETETYLVYLRLKDGINYEKKIKNLESELNIESKQIKECPARENFSELYRTDVKVIGVILIICMVVFYGVYRIASITRKKQYGILRAVGMKKKQLQKMILAELYQIYCISVPVGIGVGLLISSLIITISGDRDREIYLYNEKVQFRPVIPVWQILICIVLLALLIGLVGYMVGRKAVSASIIETISGIPLKGKGSRSVFEIGKSGSKISTLFRMGCKYIFKDGKTSCFVILTICLGVTLFTALAYRAQILKIYRGDTKEMWYLNGQYAMTMQFFERADQGITRQSAAEIQKINEVTSVKTASGIPIRVIDEDKVERNHTYYEEHNNRLKELYGYADAGTDGKDQVYKSILYGYNTKTLEALKKHVISGDYNPNNIKEDEVILSVLRMDDTKENKIPGTYREGTPLMQYKVGDQISIKYRADLETDTDGYEKFADTGAKYVYKTYKIVAIVSFPYIYDCNRTIYPLLITSDQQIQKIAPNSCFQCMYVDGKKDMSLEEQIELEHQLIKICNQNNNVSTRSLISEIEQNEMFYRKQMIYVYGIAIVVFVLVMINMINNLRYRMQARTREICMLRAIGMSIAMTKRMLLFENMILGMAAIIVAFLISHPVLRYLYKLSDMRAFGHPFQYNYLAFGIVSAVTLFLCMLLSFGILKSWKTKKIIEGIGNIE